MTHFVFDTHPELAFDYSYDPGNDSFKINAVTVDGQPYAGDGQALWAETLASNQAKNFATAQVAEFLSIDPSLVGFARNGDSYQLMLSDTVSAGESQRAFLSGELAEAFDGKVSLV